MGDREKQDAIRAADDLQHCSLLKQDANACAVCPKNPRINYTEPPPDIPAIQECEFLLPLLQAGFTIDLKNISWDLAYRLAIAKQILESSDAPSETPTGGNKQGRWDVPDHPLLAEAKQRADLQDRRNIR